MIKISTISYLIHEYGISEVSLADFILKYILFSYKTSKRHHNFSLTFYPIYHYSQKACNKRIYFLAIFSFMLNKMSQFNLRKIIVCTWYGGFLMLPWGKMLKILFLRAADNVNCIKLKLISMSSLIVPAWIEKCRQLQQNRGKKICSQKKIVQQQNIMSCEGGRRLN